MKIIRKLHLNIGNSHMTKNTSFKIPQSFLNNLDYLVHVGFFNSRGEAIRVAIEDYIMNNYEFLFEKEKKEVKTAVKKKIIV